MTYSWFTRKVRGCKWKNWEQQTRLQKEQAEHLKSKTDNEHLQKTLQEAREQLEETQNEVNHLELNNEQLTDTVQQVHADKEETNKNITELKAKIESSDEVSNLQTQQIEDLRKIRRSICRAPKRKINESTWESEAQSLRQTLDEQTDAIRQTKALYKNKVSLRMLNKT